MKAHFVWLLLMICLGSVAAQAQSDSLETPAKEQFYLFLLVGQSNMAGRGVIEEQDQKPHPRVLTLSKDLKWQHAVAPLHFDKPGIVGVGIGGTFGREIAEVFPEATIGLIPCAVGGSPIDSWTKGAYYPPTKSHPWDDAIQRAKHASQFGEIKGILWHQGESDSKEGFAESYEGKLHLLIERLRAELNATNVPFIAGQMGQFEERPWNEDKKLVDRAHHNIANRVTRTAFVNSDGLHHKGDEIHFDSASYRLLGHRYAQAWLELGKP
jgi:hypothetical protein